jgi:hypothetical protein
MTVQISRRGKEYLETARTLLRAAQTMTDRAIAGQLKALAASMSRFEVVSAGEKEACFSNSAPLKR